MQIRKCKESRRVKLSMNKLVSFSAEGKFSVGINTERLHTVPTDTVSSVCISCFLVHIYLAGTCYLGLEYNILSLILYASKSVHGSKLFDEDIELTNSNFNA